MKRIISALSIAAMAAMATSPSFADTKAKVSANNSGIYYTETAKNGYFGSKLIGSRLYAAENDVTGDEVAADDRKSWNDIGEIEDLVVTRSGEVKAVIVGIGGFLGIGEKDVAVKMTSLKFVREKGDDKGDYFVVVRSSKDDLMKAPAYKK